MKPFKKGALLIILAICCKVQAQKEAVNWVFGDFSGVNFSCQSPQLFQSPFSGLEGGSCISSAEGELLFMTDGDIVWSKDFRIMPNGRGLGGQCTNYGERSSSSQSALIVPHPGNPALYYVFTTDCAEDSFDAGLRYSIIDITMNGGLGDVIEKNKPMVAPAAEKVAAIFAPNGKDVWVVTHGVFDNTFYAFSVTDAGLNLTPVISNTGQVHPGGRGYLKFSPDGERLVAASFIYSSNDGISPEIFSFDGTSGSVTSEFILPAPSKSIYAASFSPNGKLLYMSCSWTCVNPTIEQFNLEAGTPQQIVDQRYTIPALIVGALQLSIDGKLYFMSYGHGRGASNGFLSVITSPNVVGAGCNPIETYITLPCWHSYGWGLPNFIESYFQTPVPGSASCDPPKIDLVESIDFATEITCGSLTANFDNQSSVRQMEIVFWGQTRMAFSWKLDFGDGSYSTSEQPQHIAHTYAKPGVYKVTLTLLLYGECVVRSTQKVIEISAVNPVFEYVQECKSLQVNLINKTIDPDNRFTWHWNFGDNSVDSTSNSKNPVHRYTVPGNYIVKLTATFECQWVTTLNIQVLPPLVISLGPDTTFCAGEQVALNADQPDVSYTWSTGYTGATISVGDPGVYAIKLNRGTCSATDTIRLTYRDCRLCNNPINRLTLGSDTTLCESDLIRLSVDNSISGSFVWSTGSTQRSIDVTNPGTYWVSAAKQNCQSSDTVNVSIRDCRLCSNPLHELTLGNDTTLCETDALKLGVRDDIKGEFLWSTGSVDRNIKLLAPGDYWVSVKTKYCGEAFDTVTVAMVDCMQCDAYTTNVMTPNGDDKNDEFTFTAGCEYYNFRMDIYNRWGNHLLVVSSPSWNGMRDGEPVPLGIYYFVITYASTGPGGRSVTHRTKGWLHVTN